MTLLPEERLAVAEQKITDQIEQFNRHLVNCNIQWQSMYRKLDEIKDELQSRLPRWATVGGIVTFSIMSAAIGYLTRATGVG